MNIIDQYKDLSSRHPEMVVLMLVGDFYEAYGETALKIAPILSLTLSHRGGGTLERPAMAMCAICCMGSGCCCICCAADIAGGSVPSNGVHTCTVKSVPFLAVFFM